MRQHTQRSKLMAGDLAPQFTAADVFGETFNLADHADEFVMLAFLRYAGCPWCNLTIHRLSLEHAMLKKQGCTVVAFVQSVAENIKKNIYDRHAVRPPFPIIGDQKRLHYDQYGVRPSLKAAAASIIEVPHWLRSVRKHGFKQTEVDGSLLMVPAVFLIAPRTQKIVKAEYGASFYDHQTFTGIYEPLIFDRV
ncbi:MAG TPA: redoxin domain-containing protein [Candidatus Saccharimonadales bacterium]|nr:redoxin domain-containing protein [Candidatus Saccharimonadales bacterium]